MPTRPPRGRLPCRILTPTPAGHPSHQTPGGPPGVMADGKGAAGCAHGFPGYKSRSTPRELTSSPPRANTSIPAGRRPHHHLTPPALHRVLRCRRVGLRCVPDPPSSSTDSSSKVRCPGFDSSPSGFGSPFAVLPRGGVLVGRNPVMMTRAGLGSRADEDHGAGVGDGVPGGGDAAAAAVELGPGPGSAAVPHAQRLLLPPQGRRGQRPGGRGRELLRRRPDAARAGGGAGALLPDGGAAGARRGRARGDRLQRGRGAVPGGGRARRHRRRLRRLRAHHGAQAPHPHRRVHRRHLRLPAPRAPGNEPIDRPPPRLLLHFARIVAAVRLREGIEVIAWFAGSARRPQPTTSRST
jgi:hypothetical protein